MAKNNKQIFAGKQQANTVQENQNNTPNVLFNREQNKDNELSKGGPAVIFGSKVEELKQKYLSKLPDLVLTKNDDTIQLPDFVFAKNDDKAQLPDVVFAKNDKEELEKKKKEFLEDLKNQEGFTDADRKNNENKLKKLAEIPVNEKSDYFFFVLVASTALGGPVGFALASLACEKLGIQPGGVIGDSRNFNSDQFMKTLGCGLLDVFFYDKNNSKIQDPLAVFSEKLNKEFDSGYDKSLAPALIDGFKSAVALVKEKFNPKKEVSPISAKCLGEANNLKHVAKVENQFQDSKNQGI